MHSFAFNVSLCGKRVETKRLSASYYNLIFPFLFQMQFVCVAPSARIHNTAHTLCIRARIVTRRPVTFVTHAFIQITLAKCQRDAAPDADSFSLAFFPSLVCFVRALVTNNRVVRCIFYNYTRVDAGASLYAPLEPVIITYHLFLPTSADYWC